MTEEHERCCLGVFAKHWTPGKVKTRLAASIGDEQAADIYRLFLETTLKRLETLPYQRTLAYTPIDQKSDFETTASVWRLMFQGEGDLGKRMRRFFAQQFDAGMERVVLLGTDSPNLPLECIREAFQLLSEKEAVFGPTEDGGYYLIGLSRPVDRLFEDIPWSTGEVWLTTQSRLKEEGIPFATVPSWYDVDTESDLNRLRDDLRHSEESELRELSSKL